MVGAILISGIGAVWAQPVFDYVARPDTAFTWEKSGEITQTPNGTVTRVKMTSQVWQGTTWRHRLTVFQPTAVRHPELCALVVTGGSPEGKLFAMATMVAQTIGMPIVVLGDIPNQPLFDNLNEDGLIAYTFAQYLATGDASWPCLFPMVKAAVRAMDVVQALSEREWGRKVDGFLVTGASKRGWTTWFTAEVDKRVKAIAPLVYDNLNLPAQMKHHLTQWGRYSEQIDDYTARGLPDILASEQGRILGSMVDPYTYRDRAAMPKLIVAGTNDRYWPLGAADNYYADLVGPKYLLYVPNSGHGLEDFARVLNGIGGLAAATTGEIAFPRFEWEFRPTAQGLELKAHSDPAPARVLVWTTTAPTTDFRGAKWASQELAAQEGGYAFAQPAPAEGHAAFFMEFTFKAGERDFPLSTQIRIVSK